MQRVDIISTLTGSFNRIHCKTLLFSFICIWRILNLTDMKYLRERHGHKCKTTAASADVTCVWRTIDMRRAYLRWRAEDHLSCIFKSRKWKGSALKRKWRDGEGRWQSNLGEQMANAFPRSGRADKRSPDLWWETWNSSQSLCLTHSP